MLRLLAYSRMKVAFGCRHALHLSQRQRGIRHVVQGADHGGAVEDAVHEGQAVDIGGDVAVARGIAQALRAPVPAACGSNPAG